VLIVQRIKGWRDRVVAWWRKHREDGWL